MGALFAYFIDRAIKERREEIRRRVGGGRGRASLSSRSFGLFLFSFLFFNE
jgi:hypothetical protein